MLTTSAVPNHPYIPRAVWGIGVDGNHLAKYAAEISQLRARLALSQGALSRLVGVSRTTVVRWEQGRVRPQPEVLERIRAIADGPPDTEPATRAAALAPDRVGEPRPDIHLPDPLTSFIGREREQAVLADLLATARLVTLVGAGGCGKTRLAIEVARAAAWRRFAGPAATKSDASSGADERPARSDRPPDTRHPTPDIPLGVWFVALAPLQEADLVPAAVAAALGVREQPGRSLTATLSDFLAPRSVLLVLDNCEHLLDACATLAADLLVACPRLRLLLTSREPLGLSGEHLLRLAPLSLPDRGDRPQVPGTSDSAERGPPQPPVLSPQSSSASAVLASDAGRLFVERVRLAESTFALTADNAEAVGQICRRLDGLPLALELAAARVRLLSVGQVAQHLDDRFRLLVGSGRDVPARHQTLRAAIDWSIALLRPPEQQLFARLAVFAGSFSLDAAVAVGGRRTQDAGPSADQRSAVHAGGGAGAESSVLSPQSSVLDGLQSLVDKSLVVKEEVRGEARYRLLETLREYAREQLLAHDAAEDALAAHAAYYLELAERAAPELAGPAAPRCLDRLDQELDNLRTALAWSYGPDGDTVTGLRIAAALWRFWYVRGHLSEGRRWLAPAERCRHDIPAGLRARLLDRAGHLAGEQGDFATARALFDESIALNRELGDTRALAGAIHHLALLEYELRNYQATRALTNEALALFQSFGDRPSAAAQLSNLALLDLTEGEYEAARARYEETIALFRELGDETMIALCLGNLGAVAHAQNQNETAHDLYSRSLAMMRQLQAKTYIPTILDRLGNITRRLGEYTQARELLLEGLRLRRELGLKNGIAESLESLAVLASAIGDQPRAALLVGAAEAILGSIGGTPFPFYRHDREQALAAMRETLGDEGLRAAISGGRLLSEAEVTELSIASAPAWSGPGPAESADTRSAPAPVATLSARERQILRLLAAGQSNKEISRQLRLSVRTVERHISNIYAKLGARGKADAIAYALRAGVGGRVSEVGESEP
jgi:predicted ATPase/DNA-binding CsgD family transcriptional regulator/DNA-binding XRE family transcriptional regulator